MAVEHALFDAGEGQWSVIAETPAGTMVTTFSGPGAKLRANAYGLWMNGRFPVPLPKELIVTDVKGRKIKLVLDGVEWSSDTKRGTITARPKNPIAEVDASGKPESDIVIGEKQ